MQEGNDWPPFLCLFGSLASPITLHQMIPLPPSRLGLLLWNVVNGSCNDSYELADPHHFVSATIVRLSDPHVWTFTG